VTLFFTVTLFTIALAAKNPAFHVWQRYWGLLFCAFILCSIVAKRYGGLSGLLLGLVICSGLYHFVNPLTPFARDYSLEGSLVLRQACASATIYAVLIAVPVLFLSRGSVEKLAVAMSALCPLGCFMLLWNLFFHGTRVGILDASSIGMFLVVILYPAFLHMIVGPLIKLKARWLTIVAVSLSVMVPVVCVVSKSATAVLGISIAIIVYSFVYKKVLISAALILVMPILLAGYLTQGKSFYTGKARIKMASLAIEHVQKSNSQTWGTGVGTFRVLGPAIQMKKWRGPGFFLWLHNDWVQLWFEFGWVGLILVLLISLKALILSREQAWLVSSLVAYGFVMCVQMPLRLFLPSLFAIVLLRLAIERPDGNTKTETL